MENSPPNMTPKMDESPLCGREPPDHYSELVRQSSSLDLGSTSRQRCPSILDQSSTSVAAEDWSDAAVASPILSYCQKSLRITPLSSVDEMTFGEDESTTVRASSTSNIQPPSKPKRSSTLRTKSRSNCFSKGLMTAQGSVPFNGSKPSDCFKFPHLTSAAGASPSLMMIEHHHQNQSGHHDDMNIMDGCSTMDTPVQDLTSISNATSNLADWLSLVQTGVHDSKCPVYEFIYALIRSNKNLYDPILLDFIDETMENFKDSVDSLISIKNRTDEMEEHHSIRLSQMNKLVTELRSELNEIKVSRRLIHDDYLELKENYDYQIEDIKSYEEQITDLNISIKHLKRKGEIEKILEATKYRGSSPWLSGFHELSQSIQNTEAVSEEASSYELTSRSHEYCTETNFSAISLSHTNLTTPSIEASAVIVPTSTEGSALKVTVYPLTGVVHQLGITPKDIERLSSRTSMNSWGIDIEDLSTMKGSNTVGSRLELQASPSEYITISERYDVATVNTSSSCQWSEPTKVTNFPYNFSETIEPIIRPGRVFNSNDTTSNTDNNILSSLHPPVNDSSTKQPHHRSSSPGLSNELLRVSLELGLDPINKSPDPLKWLDGLDICGNTPRENGVSCCPRCGYTVPAAGAPAIYNPRSLYYRTESPVPESTTLSESLHPPPTSSVDPQLVNPTVTSSSNLLLRRSASASVVHYNNSAVILPSLCDR